MASLNDAAEYLGISRPALSRLVAAGVLPRQPRAGYDLDVLRVAVIRHYRDAIDTREPSDLDNERARLAHHKANLAALAEDELRADLVRADELRAAFDDVVEIVRRELAPLPDAVAREVAGTDDRTVRDVIDRAILAALARLAGMGG